MYIYIFGKFNLNQQYNKLIMNIQNRASFLQLPFHLIQQIINFLNIRDINQLSICSKVLYSIFFIHVQIREKIQLTEIQDIQTRLYWQIFIQNKKKLLDSEKQLKCIKFIFIAKDQSRIYSEQFGASIQAEFINIQRKKISQQNNQSQKQQRLTLAKYFCNNIYLPQIYYLDNEEVLNESNKINIYLKSQRSNLRFTCKKMQMRKIYGHPQLEINKNQLRERLKINRKKSILLY